MGIISHVVTCSYVVLSSQCTDLLCSSSLQLFSVAVLNVELFSAAVLNVVLFSLNVLNVVLFSAGDLNVELFSMQCCSL